MKEENNHFTTTVIYDNDEFEIEYELESIEEGDMHKRYAPNITKLLYKGVDLMELNSICDRVAEITEGIEKDMNECRKWSIK